MPLPGPQIIVFLHSRVLTPGGGMPGGGIPGLCGGIPGLKPAGGIKAGGAPCPGGLWAN